MSKDKKKKKKKVHAEKDHWQLKLPHTAREVAPTTRHWELTDYSGWAHTSVNVEFTHNGTRYRGTAYPVGSAE